MEAIVNSVLAPYFQVLFKNFVKGNLSVNFLEGLSQGLSSITLKDLGSWSFLGC
jgi:hypothetical protein